jgi:V/A-type H+-transporting ATPase subunit A
MTVAQQTTENALPAEKSGGMIVRVNGPIVEARGMSLAAMLEVVEVGDLRLIGEVIRLHDDRATIQVYEHTGGLKPGDPVYLSGRSLSVMLGPGLIGNIYDGIQRPLEEMARQTGHYIGRGQKPDALDAQRKWTFTPTRQVGETLKGGECYGTVQETGVIKHQVMVPPDLQGRLSALAPEGEYAVSAEIGQLETDAGLVPLRLAHAWPVRRPRPSQKRLALDMPLVTGLRVIDTFFPLTKGGTAAIPGGFGTGKTMTQHSLAKWSAAQVIVYIGCGERGNEMTEVLKEFPKLIDPRTGRSLMERTILIANTSNMPVAAREVSIYTGITIAEYYRDMGYDVAVMADSTSRWAEALRELSGRLEEMPADEGFPAYLPTRLAEFYERAGKVSTLSGEVGSVSVIGAVSPPGGDFSEPVTQHTSRFIRCFWALDRELANARHYPAIGWLNSYSEYIPDVLNWWQQRESDWPQLRNDLMDVLQQEVKLQRIAKLVGPDALPDVQRLVLFLADLIKNAFLQQNSFDEIDMFCSPEKQTALMRMLVQTGERSRRILKLGGTLADIRELPGMTDLIRIKSTVGNDDAEGLRSFAERLNKQFDELERKLA